MQSVSTDFLTAADASIRKPIGMIEVVWSDARVEPIDSVVATTSNRGSQDDQIANTKHESNYKYTLLDGTWELNQDYHLAPETASEIAIYEIGYYGNELSASTSPYAFSTAETVTVNFSSRSIQGVSVVGDKILNEYPTSFRFRIYDGVTILYEKTVTGNTSVSNFYKGVYNNVDSLELTIYNWSAPDTCCKMVEFFTSFVSTYNGDDIITMDLLEEREIRDSTLPIGNISSNELNFSLQNFIYGYGEWVEAGQEVLIKTDTQDVTSWAVFAVINNGSGSFIDTYTCPHEVINGVDTWKFNYYYTIPSLSTNDAIYLYFVPTGADTGKPGQFQSTEWIIQDIIREPYTPENPSSFFTSFMKPNRRINAYLGFILSNGAYEYIPIGTFWNNDWVIDDDKLIVSTDCRDRLGVLKDSVYSASPLFINKSLYYIANTILTYAAGSIPMADLSWDIDTTLSSIVIPYAFFANDMTYFDVMEQITKACLGQCYMSKDDQLIIESYNKNLNIDAPTSIITKNSYYSVEQTFSYREILNKININYFTYTLSTSSTFYTTEDIDIDASETLDPITIKFSNFVNDAGISVASTGETGGVTISIDAEEHYCWGSIITVSETSGNAGTFQLAFTGSELEGTDTKQVSVEDATSISEFSEKEYDFPDNELIQNEATAIIIGEAIIDTYSDPSSDITVNYGGNPAVELADTMRVTVFKRDTDNILKDFIIYKSEISFDGTLTGTLYGKKRTYTGDLGSTLQDSDNAVSGNLFQDTDGASEVWQDTDI